MFRFLSQLGMKNSPSLALRQPSPVKRSQHNKAGKIDDIISVYFQAANNGGKQTNRRTG